MKYYLSEYSHTLWVLLFVGLGLVLAQPLYFILAGAVVLYALWHNPARYFFWAYFIVLSFYGSYTLFGIEPLFAPTPIKIGKDLVWLFFLIYGLWRLPKYSSWARLPFWLYSLVGIFISYIIFHALIVPTSWSERLLEVRYYVEYIPLLLLPLLFTSNLSVINKNIVEMLMIGFFVALFSFVQPFITGISVLGDYRVNSTLPNFFHMSFYLNAVCVLGVALFLNKFNSRLRSWWMVIAGAFVFILSYASLHSDSRGLILAYYVSWLIIVVMLWRRTKWVLYLFLLSVVAGLVFFTAGPDWARSRYISLITQLTSQITIIRDNNTLEERSLTELLSDNTLSYEEKQDSENRSVDRSVIQRVVKVQTGISYVQRQPLFGNGLLLMEGNLNTAFASDFFLLDMWVHLGGVGVGLFLAMIGGITVFLFSSLRSNARLGAHFIIVVIIAIITQYMVSSLTTSSWIAFPVNALFWLMAGIGIAVADFSIHGTPNSS
jgi:hypothetical protein